MNLNPRKSEDGEITIFVSLPPNVCDLVEASRAIAAKRGPDAFGKSFMSGLDMARATQNWKQPEPASRKDWDTVRLRFTKEQAAEIERVLTTFHEAKWRVITAAIRMASKDRTGNIFSDARKAREGRQSDLPP